MGGWVQLGWPTADTLSTKWSSVDHKSGIRDSLPDRGRRLKHWASPLDHIKQRLIFIYHACWTKSPRTAYHWLLAIQSRPILWLHQCNFKAEISGWAIPVAFHLPVSLLLSLSFPLPLPCPSPPWSGGQGCQFFYSTLVQASFSAFYDKFNWIFFNVLSQ